MYLGLKSQLYRYINPMTGNGSDLPGVSFAFLIQRMLYWLFFSAALTKSDLGREGFVLACSSRGIKSVAAEETRHYTRKTW